MRSCGHHHLLREALVTARRGSKTSRRFGKSAEAMLAALWLCGIVGFAMRTCSSSVRLSWRSSLTVRRDPFEVGHRASNHSDTLTELDFRGMIQVAAATSELCVCINSRGGLKATGHISSRLGSMFFNARTKKASVTLEVDCGVQNNAIAHNLGGLQPLHSARDRLQDDVRPRKGDMNVTCAETRAQPNPRRITC